MRPRGESEGMLIYCPKCECACPADTDVCPRCKHVLSLIDPEKQRGQSTSAVNESRHKGERRNADGYSRAIITIGNVVILLSILSLIVNGLLFLLSFSPTQDQSSEARTSGFWALAYSLSSLVSGVLFVLAGRAYNLLHLIASNTQWRPEQE